MLVVHGGDPQFLLHRESTDHLPKIKILCTRSGRGTYVMRRALQLAMSCIATVHRRFTLQGSCRASDQLQFRVLGGRLLARQRLTDWRHIRPTSRPWSFKQRAICRGQDCADFPATSDDSQSKPTKFLHFLRQQAALAAGALFIFMLLVRPITTRWHQAHQPIADPTPAAVWLPRSATDQESSKPTQAERSMPASMYAAMSSGIPATSSRLLRISDACLMQLTVTLQQVRDS